MNYKLVTEYRCGIRQVSVWFYSEEGLPTNKCVVLSNAYNQDYALVSSHFLENKELDSEIKKDIILKAFDLLPKDTVYHVEVKTDDRKIQSINMKTLQRQEADGSWILVKKPKDDEDDD